MRHRGLVRELEATQAALRIALAALEKVGSADQRSGMVPRENLGQRPSRVS